MTTRERTKSEFQTPKLSKKIVKEGEVLEVDDSVNYGAMGENIFHKMKKFKRKEKRSIEIVCGVVLLIIVIIIFFVNYFALTSMLKYFNDITREVDDVTPPIFFSSSLDEKKVDFFVFSNSNNENIARIFDRFLFSNSIIKSSPAYFPIHTKNRLDDQISHIDYIKTINFLADHQYHNLTAYYDDNVIIREYKGSLDYRNITDFNDFNATSHPSYSGNFHTFNFVKDTDMPNRIAKYFPKTKLVFILSDPLLLSYLSFRKLKAEANESLTMIFGDNFEAKFAGCFKHDLLHLEFCGFNAWTGIINDWAIPKFPNILDVHYYWDPTCYIQFKNSAKKFDCAKMGNHRFGDIICDDRSLTEHCPQHLCWQGLYLYHFYRWEKQLRDNKFLFISQNALFANPRETFESIYRFLEINGDFMAAIDQSPLEVDDVELEFLHLKDKLMKEISIYTNDYNRALSMLLINTNVTYIDHNSILQL